MLKENPDLYYKVLPYAQVLGVTDAWTDKFAGLSMSAPEYVTYHGDFMFDFIIWNTMFRSMSHSFAETFVSRPSPSGGGGGFGGGFGGGGGRGC